MKSIRTLPLLALALLLTPAALAADFGVRLGQYNDLDAEDTQFVGAEMLFDLGAVNLNPNVEYLLDDNITAGSANLDLTIDVGRFSRVTPFVGAGVGLWYVDDDFGDNTTDLLGNLIGGVQFDLDFIKPYAQVKYFRVLDDDDGNNGGDDLAFTVGLRF
jgi:opacity protein-like surface antigen